MQMLQKYPTRGVTWEVPGAGPGGRVGRLPLVVSEGTGKCGVALVGEAGGHHEQLDGLPFRPWAEAGAVLANALRVIGLPRDGYLITNTVWWQPHNNELVGQPWEESAKAICRPWNQALFAERGIRCLIALGATAFYELTGRMEISVLRDRGYVYVSKPEYGSLPVVLTYHPSLLARGSKEKSQETKAKTEKSQSGGMAWLSVLVRDIKLGVAIALKGLTRGDLGNKIPHLERYAEIAGTDRPGYVLNAGPEDWDRLIADARDNPDLAISYDYETNFTFSTTDESEYEHAMREVNQVQACIRPGQAIVSGWEDWVLGKLTRLLELGNDKLDYNGRAFDRTYNDAMLIRRVDGWLGNWVPEVRDMLAKSLPVGNYHDLMQMWHHWEPDLPQGLQYACSMIPEISLMGAWKYLIGQDERFYGAMDVDYPQRLWRWLKKNLQGISHPISKVNLLQGYRRQVNELSAKSLDQMQRRGIPVDEGERMQVWRYLQGLKKQKIQEIQGMVPDVLRPPKQKLGLKTVPLWLRKQGPEAVAAAATAGVVHHPVSGKRFELREFKLKDSPLPQPRWCELKDFNPNSTFQIRDYIRWRRAEEIRGLLDKPCRHGLGYQRAQDCPECQARAEDQAKWKVPKKFRSDDETTDKKELRRLNNRLRDPIIDLAIEYKELDKMAGTYVGGPGEDSPEGQALAKRLAETGKGKAPTQGWRPNPKTFRVHPFFTTAPATGQLSSRNPNAQNFPKHNLKFAKLLRGMVKAPPGYRIIEGDFKSFHVLTTGFEAKDELYMRLAKLDMHSFFTATGLLKLYRPDEVVKMSNADMMALFKELRGDHTARYKIAASPTPVDFKFVRDKQGKPCIAKGQRVLTDRGLVAIEDVTIDMRVWDGVEWVRHSGVIYKGYREVISYDGLTATPDHQVLSAQGQPISIGDAASQMVRIETTGAGRQAIRTGNRSALEASAQRRLLAASLQVPDLCQGGMDRKQLVAGWADLGLYYMRTGWQFLAAYLFRPTGSGSGPAIRCNQAAVRESQGSELWALRRAGSSEFIPDPCGVYNVCYTEFAPSLLSASGDRQGRQQWPLSAGESEASHSGRTTAQSATYGYGDLARTADAAGGFPVPLHVQLDSATGQTGADRGTDLGQVSSYAHVYDIANAGPRFAYTVENKLVFNCILGYGFGMQAARLWHENQEFIAGKQDAQRLITTLDELFPITHKWKSQIQELAHKQGYLVSAHGYIRRFNSVFRYKPMHRLEASRVGQRVLTDRGGMRWLVENGDDAEAAIAFLPANDAFGRIKEAMIELEDCGAGEEIGICNQIHDSLVAVCRDGLEKAAIKIMQRKMQEESRYLILPNGRGLECEVEFSISGLGESWAQCAEIKKLEEWLNG